MPSRMIQLRKLVAVELFYLGLKLISAEYAIAVAAGLLVAVLSLRAGLQVTHARWQIVLGLYLWFIALTSALLTAHAIAMARRGNCRDEIADELELDTTIAILRKYRRQSLWLLCRWLFRGQRCESSEFPPAETSRNDFL
jgi:hypothetical protein